MKAKSKGLLIVTGVIAGLMAVGCTSSKMAKQSPEDAESDIKAQKSDALWEPMPNTVDAKGMPVMSRKAGRAREGGAIADEALMLERKMEARKAYDWGPRYVELLEFCGERFTEPEIGSKISLSLENGTEVTGILKKVTKRRVDVTVDSGGSVRLAPDQLSKASRCLLFKTDFMEHFASKRLEEEKSIYQATGRLPQ
jgi:hypothetical protein